MKTQDFGWIRISLKNSSGDSGNWPSARGTSEMSHTAPSHSDEPLALRKLQWHFPAAYASFLAPGKNGQVHPHVSTHRTDKSSTTFKTDVCPLQILFLEAHCAEVMSIDWLFILLSASGMLIKSEDLNHCFPSANSQKVSWCILCPEGKWKLCVVCSNYFLCCCSLSRHIDVSRGWLFINWQGEGRVWGQMQKEAGNSQFFSSTSNSFQTDTLILYEVKLSA